ncbi:MAG: hypothetical protein KU38_12970 [Sulfurovum sp. FS08-3]|nr:MAG: hypothetical protein KU38_12970 [Sulfurovum sp. FS08-3]
MNLKFIELLYIHFYILCIYKSQKMAIVFLDSVLYQLMPNYGLWNFTKGVYNNFEKYQQYNYESAIESWQNVEEFMELVCQSALMQINDMKEYLNITRLNQSFLHYIQYTRLDDTPMKPLPPHTEAITKELLLRGEIKRGEVRQIIHREQRTATQLIRDLIDLKYLKSDSPKGAIRLNFTMEMVHFMFPNFVK